MATTISNQGLVEAVQNYLINKKYVPYLKGVTTEINTAKRLGDSMKVQVVSPAAAAAFNASTENYITGSGSIVGVDVPLNKRSKATIEMTQEIKDRVRVQAVADGLMNSVLKKIADDIWATAVIATYTTTPVVIGASSNFDRADFIGLKTQITTLGLDPATTTFAAQAAYVNGLEATDAVARAKAIDGTLMGSGSDSALIARIDGVNVIRTEGIPVGTNIVGAYFDINAFCVAFGSASPFADDNTVAYQEVSDPETGFTIGLREVHNVATGSKFVTVEAVYGIKEGIASKLVLLASA